MLDLSASSKALDRFGQQFLDETLPADLSAEDFRRFDRGAHDAADLAYGAESWGLRTLDEYRSQVGFTFLLADLTTLGLSFDVLSAATRVVRDEARHVEICRRLHRTLGGSNRIEGEPNYVLQDPRKSPMQRVLDTVVGSLCIGESLSVRLIGAVRQTATDPLAHRVMTVLLADESFHSRFGWMMLELLWPHVSAKEQRITLAQIGPLMRSAEGIVLPAGGDFERCEAVACAPLNPFGAIADNVRREVFYDALDRDVITRFEALGIKARHAFDMTPKEIGG